MSFKSRRIIKPWDIIAPIPEFPEQSSEVVLSRRFTSIDSPISSKTNVRKVFYSNLDENNHFNNTETAAFAIDEISHRITNGEHISSVEIHFNHESRLGDKLEISTFESPIAAHIKAFNTNFDSNAFECYMIFDNNM